MADTCNHSFARKPDFAARASLGRLDGIRVHEGELDLMLVADVAGTRAETTTMRATASRFAFAFEPFLLPFFAFGLAETAERLRSETET